MNINEFDKILIIISTASSNYTKIKNKIKNKLNKIMDKNKYIIRLTRNKTSNYDITSNFIYNNSNSLIISVGGDGSISEVSNAIYKHNREDIYFSFLPNGTGNDFAKSIYGKKTFDEILENIEYIRKRKIDLIQVNDLTSINSTGFGFESVVLKNSLIFRKKIPFLRKFSYFLGIFISLKNMKPIKYKYKFTLEDNTVVFGTSESIMNSLCNGLYYGSGFMPAPTARIDDGIIDFNYIDYMGIFKFISLISSYKSSKHMNLEPSHTQKVKSGVISSLNGELDANIDGNIYNFEDLTFKILPNAINLVEFKQK